MLFLVGSCGGRGPRMVLEESVSFRDMQPVVSCSASGRRPHTCAHLCTPVHTYAHPCIPIPMDVQAALCWLSGFKGEGKKAHEVGENWCCGIWGELEGKERIWLKYVRVLNSLKNKENG